MFKHLVAALDGSESSLHALDVAIDLATRANASLDIVSVVEEAPKYVATREESALERSVADAYYGRLHEDAIRRAERQGLTARTVILNGHEVQALVDYICTDGYDLLVLGHRGHSGVWGAFLGSTADKLVGHAPCSVLVTREQGRGRVFKRILVGLDGSPLGQRALESALRLARLWGAHIHVVSVVEGSLADNHPGSCWTSFFEQVQATAIADALVAGLSLQAATRQGHAAAVIIEQARREECDLILVGATGHERPWSPTTGGTARKVANEAGCAVLVVRPPLIARQVQHVMTHDVASVSPTATTAEVVDMLIRRSIKAVPVVDGQRRVLGIITGGDLLARGRLGLRLSVQRDLSSEELASQIRALETNGQTARDVMTPNPLTIRREAALEDAVHLMVTRKLKRLPVTADRGLMAGMISRIDVLRHLAGAPEPPPEAHQTLPIRARTIGEVMDLQVPIIASTALAEDVLRKILSMPLRRVVVIDDDHRALGIITDRDLLTYADSALRPGLMRVLAGLVSPQPADGSALAPPRASGPVTALDLMNPHIFTVRAETPLIEAIRQMVTRRVKRLVVLDAEGRPIGFVDRQCLLQSLVAPNLDSAQ